MKISGEELKKVNNFFKYLGTVVENGGMGYHMERRHMASAAWGKWSGVLCDKKITSKLKGKIYRTVARPALVHG